MPDNSELTGVFERMNARLFRIAPVILAMAVAGCGGHAATPPMQQPQLSEPKSLSPALIKPAPMAKTSVLPASAMTALTPHGVRPQMPLQGLTWTQMTGAATQVVGSPDGSLWVLSTQPAGPDKYIWHYAKGQWTNIPGLASQLAVTSSGGVYVINSGGGTYQYDAGFNTWYALGGGARWLTVARNGDVFVLSNAGGPDYAIWKNSLGSWSQVPGAGVVLAASWDTGTYNATVGTIKPGGIYILNSAGSIYYLNTDNSYAMLGGAASAIAPTNTGGLFVLASPTNPNGNPIYYYDLQNSGWSAYGGSGTSISVDNLSWTSGSNLYVVSGPAGAIFSSPILSVSPAIRTVDRISNAFSIQTLVSSGGMLYWSDGSSVGTMSTAGVAGSAYTIPNNGGNVQMTVGPDGNMWLTQAISQIQCYSCQDYIVRMQTSGLAGAMNSWVLPVPSGFTGSTHSNPVSIASGSDGNLWVTESNMNANQLARVTTSGVVTPYPIATDSNASALDLVQSVAAGPDGNLWFIITDEGNGYDEIGKSTTSGTITRYHLPSAYSFSGPGSVQWNGIVSAPDGNLWFTEANGNRIGKITTAGTITEYPLPAGTNPQNIGVGPDGNLWLRCGCGSAGGAGLVKVTTAGSASGPYLMQNQQVLTLTTGPDQHLWFGSGGGNIVQVAM